LASPGKSVQGRTVFARVFAAGCGSTPGESRFSRQIIPFPNCSCREDEPKTVLEARRGEVDKGTGNLEME
jgi:hypothetical protein